MCEDCKHYINGARCRAFDFITLEVYGEPEKHTSVLPGQNGDYVFETDKPRDTMHACVPEDAKEEDDSHMAYIGGYTSADSSHWRQHRSMGGYAALASQNNAQEF